MITQHKRLDNWRGPDFMCFQKDGGELVLDVYSAWLLV